MKFFLDTEFVEDGVTIDLISIAIVSEDDRAYYAVSNEFDIVKAATHPFVGEHVWPKLPHQSTWKPRARIAQEIVDFVGVNPEFWADYGAYDWVAICQLYGAMVNLPPTWPYFAHDIQQWKSSLGVASITEVYFDEHDALADAYECQRRYHILRNVGFVGRMTDVRNEGKS